MNQQTTNLARVTAAIGKDVLAFCWFQGVNGTFHADELHKYVGDKVAPASADRILRNLRQKGYIDYIILDRRASFYQLTAMNYSI
jgi:hypothetical protein